VDKLQAEQEKMKARNQKQGHRCHTFQPSTIDDDEGIEHDQHYSIPEIAKWWNFGVDKTRDLFKDEPAYSWSGILSVDSAELTIP
jgi:hypothetical protein